MATAAAGTMSEPGTRDFERFYEEWFDRVYDYARHRTGSPVRADEIVSDTFARVLESWERFDPGKGDERTWLFSIAFRAVADHYRSEKRRRWFSLGLLSGRKEETEKPGRDPGHGEDVARLMAALGRLSDQQREVVTLKFFSGMSNRTIAGLTGLSEANVAVMLFRCVRRMRKRLSGEEADHG